jgi:hypothetical protein
MISKPKISKKTDRLTIKKGKVGYCIGLRKKNMQKAIDKQL